MIRTYHDPKDRNKIYPEFTPNGTPTGDNDRLGDYKVGLLRETFFAIAPDNWKEPIKAIIPSADTDLVDKAITFCSGGTADFAPSGLPGYTAVVHKGYYHHIGA